MPEGMKRLLLLLMLPWAVTAQAEPIWLSEDADGAARVHLYLFWSPTCPHCGEARKFIEPLPEQYPWITLHSGNLVADREQATRYTAMAAALGQEARSVPAIFVCGNMLVGWDGEGLIGAELMRLAEQCRDEGVAATGELMPAGLGMEGLSLPLFTLIIAGMDAFNPCAFFVLLFLLSLLVKAGSRRRMLLIGATFVLVSGLVYFLFMAAWLNLFLLLGGMPWISATAGALALGIGLFGIKDFLTAMRGPSLSIPASAKPRLFARMRGLLSAERLPLLMLGTITLALAANSYELLCTAGFPMVYTRTLTLHELAPAHYYAYLLLYNLIYITPLMLIVMLFAWSLGARKLSLEEGRLLKLLSGVMMGGLGLVLLLMPELLNNALTGLGLLALALAVTLMGRLWMRRIPPV